MSDVQVDVGSGIWHCERDAHTFDAPLADVLAKFFLEEKAQVIADAGCGSGDYVKHLRKFDLNVFGFDGNPRTPEFCEKCFVRDLTAPGMEFWLPVWPLNRWILCLEVGEHIPPDKEKTFLDNLANSSSVGIVLSWFPTEGHGIGHFNPKPNEYVKAKMAERGFKSDDEAQERLRKAATCWWFTLSLMTFRRM